MVTDDHWTSGASRLFARSTSNHSTLPTQMTQEQLIRCIEQQLENLAHFDEDLAWEYECALYYDSDQPIVENFTPKLLTELENLILQLDNEPVHYQ